MTAASDDELMEVAPNLLVQVGTPPPFESDPIEPEEGIPQFIYTILDIESRKTKNIGSDRTQDLITLTKKKTPPTNFLIKNYFHPSAVTNKYPPSPPLPPPPPPPPASPGSRRSTNDELPDLPDNIPFDEIKYDAKDLVGVGPPLKPLPPPPPSVPSPPGPPPTEEEVEQKRWTALQQSMHKSFQNFPSAVYIKAIASCISTPYWAPEDKRHRNGALRHSGTGDAQNTTYLWQCDGTVRFTDGREVPRIAPRIDGAITIVPLHRAETSNQVPPVYLYPGAWEKREGSGEDQEGPGINNGDSLNSFSLILGISPGGGDAQSQAAAYSIGINFGDISVRMYEGMPEALVYVRGMTIPERVMIRPSRSSGMTSGFGPRPYVITFIPVWNGILISDGIPGSSDWSESVNYIPRDKDLDVNKAIRDITNPPRAIGLTIPKCTVKRKGKRYKAPAVRLADAKKGISRLNMGKRLNVEFIRCGGSMKFVPLYFPKFSRYHFVYPGAAHPDDLKANYVNNSLSRRAIRAQRERIAAQEYKEINPNVFKVKSHSKSLIMPIFSFESAESLDFRTNLTTIVTDKIKPFACLSMEFKSLNGDVRRPMQVWGAVVLDETRFEPGGTTKAPPNSEGALSINAISVPRIRSFNIQRGLDGSSGEILWDRWDPITQTLDPRPLQEVGAIQVHLSGGANTVPGTVFTGIAYGNSEDNNPGENLVRIPLKGRESKISSEGGLALVNVPFFDGYDHRRAMRYMANYAGFPINTDLTEPFRLISSYNINNPILDFPAGTPVDGAMNSICGQASTVYYFDRFGTLIYLDVEKSTPVNWNYSDLALETFSDTPESTWVRNLILISALVVDAGPGAVINGDFASIPTKFVIIRVPLSTYPEFPWAKMAVYTIPRPVRDMNELNRLAVQIAKGQSRPRSAARCRIPGNASIELLDRINTKWIITSISHNADTQRKTWTTDLGVELFEPERGVSVGPPEVIPISRF